MKSTDELGEWWIYPQWHFTWPINKYFPLDSYGNLLYKLGFAEGPWRNSCPKSYLELNTTVFFNKWNPIWSRFVKIRTTKKGRRKTVPRVCKPQNQRFILIIDQRLGWFVLGEKSTSNIYFLRSADLMVPFRWATLGSYVHGSLKSGSSSSVSHGVLGFEIK